MFFFILLLASFIAGYLAHPPIKRFLTKLTQEIRDSRNDDS